MPKPRAVICDFGGVLTSPLIESFVAYQESSGIAMEDLGRALQSSADRLGEHPLFELEKGTISEEEFIRRVEAELGEGVKLTGFREIYFEHLKPNPRMIEWTAGLRGRGLRTALLTNNVREWEPLWRAKLPELDDIFEIVVDSAFVGMRKPDPEIYTLTLERLGDGVQPSECVFVDDLEPNCQTAGELGMTVVQFRHAEQAIAEAEAALTKV
jgi:epoxide hydrolase-like predicted phosphatase